MGELGDLLELLNGARRRYRTLRAVVLEWHHTEREEHAFRRHVERLGAPRGGMTTLYGSGRIGHVPQVREATVRLWLEQPDRAREEREDDLGDSFSVRDGRRWWSYSPHWGATSDEARPGAGPGVDSPALLFDPAPLLSALELEPAGRASALGRDAILARARPRQAAFGGELALQLLGLGLEEAELLVDAERGVLLRSSSRADGEEFFRLEVTELAFDERIPPERFIFVPPPGETVRSAGLPRGIHDVSIEEAARAAPFTVWLLDRVPPGWRLSAHWLAAIERPPIPAMVIVDYVSEDGAHRLHLQETATSDPDPLQETPWEQRGDALVSESEQTREAHVQVERDGTRVRMTSDLGAGELLRLAERLVRAPTEPPTLS